MNMHKKLYLITGFLGAGKTTLMKNLIHIFNDKKIAVIVNEFGQQGVDGTLLSNEGLKVTEINNGSVFCVCRSDLFVDALVKALKTDSEVVLVETSGLSDPTGMNKILDTVNNVANEMFEYCGAVAVVDATNFMKLIKTAVAVGQQIISSDLVLINKTDLVDEKIIQKIEYNIAELNPGVIVKNTSFSEIKDTKWVIEMKKSSDKNRETFIKKKAIGTQKLLVIFNGNYKKRIAEEWMNCFSNDIYRIKGFLNLEEGLHYIDGIGGKISVLPSNIEKKQSYLVILASGDSPVKKKLLENWGKYFNEPAPVL